MPRPRRPARVLMRPRGAAELGPAAAVPPPQHNNRRSETMTGPGITRSILFAAACAALGSAAADAPAAPAVELFAPGTVSGPANDWTPVFSPDGKTMYFWRSATSWGFILESHQTDKGWSEPTIASFSGEYPDSSPAMAPDGS